MRNPDHSEELDLDGLADLVRPELLRKHGEGTFQLAIRADRIRIEFWRKRGPRLRVIKGERNA